MASETRQQLEAWLKTIDVPENSRVLDVGGSQLPIKGRTKTWAAAEYEILDLPEPHVLKTPPDIKGNIENLGVLMGEDYYNIIFCLEVSEYWTNPLMAMTNLACALKRGGTLYISFHFVYPIHEPIVSDSLRYTPGGVNRLLSQTDFTIAQNVPRYARVSGAPLNFYLGEGMRPAKSVDHDVVGNLIKAVKI